MASDKMSFMGIEAILFDLGGVIVDFNMSFAFNAFAEKSLLGRDRFEGLIRDTDWLERYECGKISTHDFCDFLQREASLDMDYDDFYVSWTHVFEEDLTISIDFLTELNRRYPMGLVSNTNEAHAEHIRKHYGVFDCFDHHILSYQVGSIKPDRKIFEYAIEVMEKEPGELLFIDDRIENVCAAEQLGMQAQQFESLPCLQRTFRKCGINLANIVDFD